MEEQMIRAIALDEGMRNEDLFVKFMQKRFPNEKMDSYVREWANRFLSGNPVCHMDLESKKIYISLLWGGIENDNQRRSC